jgi:hypothetical protein
MHAQRFHDDTTQQSETIKLLEHGRRECFLAGGILQLWRQFHQFVAKSRLQSWPLRELVHGVCQRDSDSFSGCLDTIEQF